MQTSPMSGTIVPGWLPRRPWSALARGQMAAPADARRADRRRLGRDDLPGADDDHADGSRRACSDARRRPRARVTSPAWSRVRRGHRGGFRGDGRRGLDGGRAARLRRQLGGHDGGDDVPHRRPHAPPLPRRGAPAAGRRDTAPASSRPGSSPPATWWSGRRLGPVVWVLVQALSEGAGRLDAAERAAWAPLALGAVLVGAGLYQLSPFKQGCLDQCRSPFVFVMQHWRPGHRGALRMGVIHGLYCLGCCLALTAVLVAVGVMSVPWMLVLTLVAFAEKVLAPRPPHGAYRRRRLRRARRGRGHRGRHDAGAPLS